jgi:hypothetical protein
LEYFDQNLVLGKFGVDYDPRHLTKRMRGQIIGKKTTVTSVVGFNRHHLSIIFDKTPNISSLLNVKDRLNVPLAVQLLELLSTTTEEGKNAFMLDVVKEIKVNNSIVANELFCLTRFKSVSSMEKCCCSRSY